MEKSIRKLAIMMLDEENGINDEVYEILEFLLLNTGSEDITTQVIKDSGQVFLGEDTAEEMHQSLEGWGEQSFIEEDAK